MTPLETKMVFTVFKRLVPSIPSCKQDDAGKPIGRPHRTRPSDAELIKVFESGDGRKLIGMHVAPRILEECDGWGGFASDIWFYVSASGSVRPLPDRRENDAWSHSIALIDIGDFDGDGSEEALFWYAGYDEDGYLLFDHDFSRVARFTWIYH